MLCEDDLPERIGRWVPWPYFWKGWQDVFEPKEVKEIERYLVLPMLLVLYCFSRDICIHPIRVEVEA